MEERKPAPRLPMAPVDQLFLGRWSPRAFDSSPLPEGTIKTLVEAVRWSPSCFNEQPWLLVWGEKPADRARILEVMNERNRSWASTAPLLAVLFGRRTFEKTGKPNRWNGFDSGAAWMSLALQSRLLGLYSHAMGGFSPERAYSLLGVPEAEYEAMACIAIGKLGDPGRIPEDMREGEHPQDNRKNPGEISAEGIFRKG